MVHFGFLYWYYNPGAVKTLNWTILRVVKKVHWLSNCQGSLWGKGGCREKIKMVEKEVYFMQLSTGLFGLTGHHALAQNGSPFGQFKKGSW